MAGDRGVVGCSALQGDTRVHFPPTTLVARPVYPTKLVAFVMEHLEVCGCMGYPRAGSLVEVSSVKVILRRNVDLNRCGHNPGDCTTSWRLNLWNVDGFPVRMPTSLPFTVVYGLYGLSARPKKSNWCEKWRQKCCISCFEGSSSMVGVDPQMSTMTNIRRRRREPCLGFKLMDRLSWRNIEIEWRYRHGDRAC